MKNLAGDVDCDRHIEHELTRAGIEIVRGERMNTEVPASITGKLGDFTFKRAWYYWMVSGNVPLTVAEELYNDPVGKEDIRVAGHCGCPPPREWTSQIGGEAFVTSYHIDTEVGLRLFVDTLHNLIPITVV